MNTILFYALNLTWGILMNIIGSLVALGLYIAGKRPTRHGGCWCYIVGRGWGGVLSAQTPSMMYADGYENPDGNGVYAFKVESSWVGVRFSVTAMGEDTIVTKNQPIKS